jgi:hypothetical protein
MGHQMGHAAFSSIRFTQFRVYMMLPEHAVYIIVEHLHEGKRLKKRLARLRRLRKILTRLSRLK